MFKKFFKQFSEQHQINKEYRRMEKIFSKAESREHLEVLMRLYDEGKL